MNQPAGQTQTLQFADKEQLRQELDLSDPTAPPVVAPADPALQQQAEDVAARVLKLDMNDHKALDQSRLAVESMGLDLQREAARRSAMLKQPLTQLIKQGEDGGVVASSLIDLKMQVEELDPASLKLDAGSMTRLLGYIPGIGTPLKRYFSRYQSASVTIDAIVRSLKAGQEQLKRDNITLTEDQKAMRALTLKLERAIRLGQMIDQKLQAGLETEILADDPKHKFIAEELLFPLRQRIQDLQQQLLVNQQGFLTSEMVIRNNKELIRGVNRALNVTVSALQVAVTLALALANQKIVLEKVQAISATTDSLIAGTASRLKTQGVDIHKQASGTQLSIETLKQSFADIRSALDDISRYRQEALPKMAQNIVEMDQLASQTEEHIKRFEHAERASKDFTIEITG
ncbi:MAG TPA: toxic anion resistance protein [Solimonas sp.]|nr:toxic anion resistance protein [Solimonas sp.]